MAEKGFPGWPAIDDLNDGQPGARGVLARQTDRSEERKKKQKRKKKKEGGRAWALLKGPWLYPSLRKNKQALLKIV